MNNKLQKQLVIYQTQNGAIQFQGDFNRKTIWASLNQIAKLFGRDKSVISRHIKNIFNSGELQEDSVVAIFATTAGDGKTYQVKYYNLDVILSVGYRVDSKRATQFRIWATKVLRQHILEGYTINKQRIKHNYEKFLQAISNIKALLPATEKMPAEHVLELVQAFASTWFSLESYDKESLPEAGMTKKDVQITADELKTALSQFKKELINKKQATSLFGQERYQGALAGIVGNVFQVAFGQEMYPTLEEKAAHLLYFIIKDHPFVDGNKRSGAFAFVWFLRKTGLLRVTFTPEALTALTILIAESKPKDKDRMIGLILLLLNGNEKQTTKNK